MTSLALNPGALLGTASQIAQGLGVIANTLHDEQVAKQKFTQKTVNKMRQNHHEFNVMVVHSAFHQSFQGSVTHVHYELPLHGTRTQGYEVFTFKSGEFQLDGDGGFENWCFGGNFVRE